MDLVLRASIAFVFIFAITRVVGKRELGSMEPFDLILLVIIGDLVQGGIVQSDHSITGMVIVVGTIALWTVLFSMLSYKSKRLRPLIEGQPLVLVEDGKPLEHNMKRERISIDELQAEARKNQVGAIEDIKWAVLETGGQISIVPKS